MPKTSVVQEGSNLSPKPKITVLLSLAPRRSSLSLTPMDSPLWEMQEEELQLPSTPKAYKVAMELIEDMAPPPPPCCDCTQAPALRKSAVPSNGKPAMMTRSHSPWHRCPALHPHGLCGVSSSPCNLRQSLFH